MLMCAVSFTLYGAMDVTIYDRYSDIGSMSSAYFCNCETYNEDFVERMDAGGMMEIGFRFDLKQDEPGGMLIYEMQRRGNAKSDHQSDTDSTSIETVEDASKIMQFLVAWKIMSHGKLRVHIVLVEHDNELVLDEDKLAQLYKKVNDIPSSHSLSRWLIYDNIALVVTYETVWKISLEFKITISEGVKDEYTKSTLWIDSERQVSLLMIIYSY
jgi:hypothetical protein